MNVPDVGIISMPPMFDALAISVGAPTGALYATRRGLDLLGILVIAFASALGGGAIRDIVLQYGTPAFLTNPGTSATPCSVR